MLLKKTTLSLLLVLSVPMVFAAPNVSFCYNRVAAQPANDPDREIAGLFDRWNNALQTGKAQNVVDLYAPNAVLQPTVSNRVRTTPEEIRDYFEHFLQMNPSGQINYREIRQLGTSVAMDSGVYTFTLKPADGKVQKVQARYTFVYERLNGQWRILNHHSSAMPEIQARHAAH